ncbi:Xaa-Pro dipeptidase [Pseudomarimonas arenosa]|uniref:Xaa-Pro dipeptidase n=1 Tax=Pseudomarimonas arenosa TaxID=2774145 RepID=A0AAW3ZS36_9GAMM|nr:Xaa-Pro dipeptidase [Pseudomarimonas arenosa]MBD8527882.1 Xaa-Pro dipeptidase [Pseudomarimonas arenosa]
MSPSSASLSALYRDHLEVLQQRAAVALQRGGYDHLLIAAGKTKYQFLDDRPYPFAINPHFKAWVPLTEHAESWLAITPGQPPRLIYFQPDDYWHLPPAAPSGYWVEHLDVQVINQPEQAKALLPDPSRAAILGEPDAALPNVVPNNPDSVINYLHFHRAYKTPYEIALMAQASARAVTAHRAAEQAFRAGASELDIHRAYLAACQHNDLDLPYGNIVALNEHAAVLHYQYQQAEKPTQSRSFLIDAGAQVSGYAADITRTYGNGHALFEQLVAGVDRVQQDLASQVRHGKDYRQIHLDTHRQLADVLVDLGVLKGSAEAAVAERVTSTFFPHGVGHLIGLQVHDVAGFQRDEDGGRIERPDGHPFLRLTRPLASGMAVTIEPGIYFIPTLLSKLKASAAASMVDWQVVEHLLPFGGVRIEDDVVCTESEPLNLTREAFARL